jgi:hypothetical protein
MQQKKNVSSKSPEKNRNSFKNGFVKITVCLESEVALRLIKKAESENFSTSKSAARIIEKAL